MLWLGAALLCKLLWEWKKPVSRLRRRFFRPFKLLILSDIVYVFGVYAPYHSANAVLSTIDPAYEITNPTVCQVWAFLASFSVTVSLLGITVVWIGTLSILRGLGAAGSHEEDDRNDSKLLRGSFFLCLAISSLWFAEATLTDTTGSFRGLFCATELSGINGVIILSLVTISFTIMGFCVMQSYKILSAPLVGGDEHSATGGLEARIRHNLGWTALKMTVVYVSCFGPLTVYCLMRLLGVQPPIELAMFAGWMTKWGPILDVILILSSSQYTGREVTPATYTPGKSSPGTSGKVSAAANSSSKVTVPVQNLAQ